MKNLRTHSILVLLALAFAFTGCSSDDDNGMVIADNALQGFSEVQMAVDGVADFIDGPIGNLTEDLGILTEANFNASVVSPSVRNMASSAVQTYNMNPSDENAIATAEATSALVIANRVAIAENFHQILAEDFPNDADLTEFINGVEEGINMPENLDAVQMASYQIIVDVQTNGAVVEFLLNAANNRFELGLDVAGYNAPSVSDMTNTTDLLNTATMSVQSVADLAVPSVEAIQAIVDELLMENTETLSTYEELRGAIDGVANFINGPIGDLTEDIGELVAEGTFMRVEVDQEARTNAMNAIEAYNENPTPENAIAASNANEALVIANRVAIIGDFQQILGEDFPTEEDLNNLVESVEASFTKPSDLSDVESAAFDVIIAVQVNGNAVEALLSIANETYELGLDVPSYMGPELPNMQDEANLLDTGVASVQAVGNLAVPSVEAIQAIIDNLLAE